MNKYVCHFTMGNSEYSINIEAENDEDIVRRIKAMKKSLVLDGKLGGEIPYNDGPIELKVFK